MIKYNLSSDDVIRILRDLDCSNYSYTELDDDKSRGGYVWIFGKSLYDSPEFFGDAVIIYIKLKIDSGVVCLSFHETEYNLSYPYN